MNSMRLLILLTVILYETHSAPSIQPLKFLKTLISKHLSSTTEQPILEEEIYPAYKCESVEDDAINDAVIEWNRQVFLVNQKPILIEVGNVGQIQNGNHNDDLTVNPETNPEVNCEENSEVNSEGNFEENPKSSPEEHKNVYEKDLNTQWLLGENPTETYSKVGTPSIKDQIINKINIIKSKLKFKNRQVIPIEELVEENKNNVGFTSGNPITTLESITTGKPTTIPHITTIQPVSTAHQYTTTVQPFSSKQPIISAQYSSTVKPESNTPDVQVKYGVESQEPIVTIPTQNQIPLQPQPIYYSDFYYPLWLNNCPPPLSHKICYNQNYYYAPSTKFSDTLNENQFTLENIPYNIPDIQNQKINNGLTKVINYIKIDANQPVYPVKPNQDEQWIHNTYDDTNPIYQNPISYYISEPVNPESQPEIVIPGNDGVYSTSTMEPIVVYPADSSIQPINQVDQTQPEYNLNQNLEPATVNSNVEVSRTPLRGDIQYGEDVIPNVNYDQPEEDSSDYLLKERRSVGQYNNDRKIISQKNNLNVPFPVSDISLVKPVSEQAETLTPANKIEIPAVTETKIPIIKIKTNIANIEKPVVEIKEPVVEIKEPVVEIKEPVPEIENPVIKIETPVVTSTKIPYLESNNVNISV